MLIQKDDYGTRFYPFVDGELKGFEGYVYVLTDSDEVRFNISLDVLTAAQWAQFKAAGSRAFDLIRQRQMLKGLTYKMSGRVMTNAEAENLLEKMDAAVEAGK